MACVNSCGVMVLAFDSSIRARRNIGIGNRLPTASVLLRYLVLCSSPVSACELV